MKWDVLIENNKEIKKVIMICFVECLFDKILIENGSDNKMWIEIIVNSDWEFYNLINVLVWRIFIN